MLCYDPGGRSGDRGRSPVERLRTVDAGPIGDVCETDYDEPGGGDYTVEASAVFPAGVELVLE